MLFFFQVAVIALLVDVSSIDSYLIAYSFSNEIMSFQYSLHIISNALCIIIQAHMCHIKAKV